MNGSTVLATAVMVFVIFLIIALFLVLIFGAGLGFLIAHFV